jgi:DNA replication protein DnaC
MSTEKEITEETSIESNLDGEVALSGEADEVKFPEYTLADERGERAKFYPLPASTTTLEVEVLTSESPMPSLGEASRGPRAEPHPLGANGKELLDSIWRNMMINHARANGIPVGKAKCEHCGEIRDWGDEPACGCERNLELQESRSVRRQQVDATIERIVPEGMRWARLGTPEWGKVEAKERRVGEFVRRWNRDAGSVLILGPTGVGKTAAAIALMLRILNRAGKPEESERNVRWALGMKFVDASELVVARRNSKLGDEAGLVEQAKRASLLVLDELGFETFSQVPYEVVNARYLSGAPTIITSGLQSSKRGNEFANRYGAAFMRRITDRGGVINLWESDS